MPEEEKKTKEQMLSDNDFAERFFKIIMNGSAMIALLVILSVTLFWGSPDLLDNISGAITRIGGSCP